MRNGTRTMHARCTRCLQALHGRMTSPGGESHTWHAHGKHLVPCLPSACTCLLQHSCNLAGHMAMSPKSFSPQHPQECSSDVGATNENTVVGIVSAVPTGGSASPSGSVAHGNQPSRCLDFLAARETYVANNFIPLQFKWETTSTTEANWAHAPPKSRRSHMGGMC